MMPAPASGTRPSRARQLVRVTLLLVMLYLLCINALINSPLLEPLVNRKPERFNLHWQRGLMLWPGHVTLWGVTMHGQAGHRQWRIEARRVSGRIALWPLLRKELHFTRIDGDSPIITLQRVDLALPPPLPDDRGLRLMFDDVRVASRLLFASGDLRVEGVADVRARWQQQLRGGPFELFPSTVRLREATLARGERVLLREATLDGTTRIDTHRRREHPGLGILDFLAFDAGIDAVTPGLSVDVDSRFALAPDVFPDTGALDGRIVFERGDLGPETVLRLRLPLVATTHSGHVAYDDATLALQVDDEHIGVTLQLPPVPDLVERAEGRLKLVSRRVPLPPWKEQWARLDGEIDLHSRFSSLAFVQPLLARLRGYELEGSGDVQARIVLARGELAAGTEATVNEAEFVLTAYSHQFRGAAQAEARIAPIGEKEQGVTAQVRLDRFDIAPSNEHGVVLGSGRNLKLDLAASGTLAELHERLQARLRFADARLPDLTHFNRYLPRQGLQFLSGSGRVGADMSMHVAEDRNGGAMTLAASDAAVRFGGMVLRADLDVDARLEARRLDEPDFALPGTRIAIRRAAIIEPADERVEGWWGRADITRGRVSLTQPMDLTAHAEVEMRDVGPLLAMFAQHKRFPRWIRNLIDSGTTRVSGRAAMREDDMIVDHVLARNDRFDVQARLKFGEEKPSGHLYARWGVLGMAMGLDRGEREFHLAGARKWFDSQSAYLPEE
ncbi:hypothetical protein OS176_05345 [Xanthomonadaceae bacterium XH05]|nr:hypothetical protein [Xanthomonadaceae bacterium XH05]